MVRVGLIGVGRWGAQLLRNLLTLPDARIVMVADLDARRLSEARERGYAGRVTHEHRSVFDSSDIEAVVIATPPSTHATLAGEALRAGKHVLVEKPMATSVAEAEELIALARRQARMLMVGHTPVYSAGIRRLRVSLDCGEFGYLRYLYTQRVNLGRVRSDINVLWELGPHDISTFLYLLGELPLEVSARGFDYVQPGIADVVFMTLRFSGNIGAHLHMSWLDPQKVRRLVLVGSRKMADYDDTRTDGKLLIHDKGVELPFPGARQDGFAMPEVRSGQVDAPVLDVAEPLRVECAHFIECIQTGQPPLTDGDHALTVIRILETAQRSIAMQGAPERLDGFNLRARTDLVPNSEEVPLRR